MGILFCLIQHKRENIPLVTGFIQSARLMFPRMNRLSQHYPLRIFYDGQCPVCNREIQRHLRHDLLGHLQAINIAAPDFNATAYGLDAQRVHDVMHVLTADGQAFTEVEAFVCIWNALPPRLDRRLLVALLRLPPVRKLADIAYRAFAQNRVRLFGGCDSTRCGPSHAVRSDSGQQSSSALKPAHMRGQFSGPDAK